MALESTTRRRFLAAGMSGAALLGTGGLLRWVSSGYSLPPGHVALALSTKEMVVVRAIVDALFPGDGPLPSGLSLEVHQRVDEEVWAQPDDVRADLKAALQLLEHAPPFFGRLARLSSLPRAARADLYPTLLTRAPDVVVQAAVAIKQIGSLHYFSHPAVWPHLGYDGPWVPEPRPPASHVRYRELLARARAAAASSSSRGQKSGRRA